MGKWWSLRLRRYWIIVFVLHLTFTWLVGGWLMHTKSIFRFYDIVPPFIFYSFWFILFFFDQIIKGDMGRFESIGSEGILEKLKLVLNSMEYRLSGLVQSVVSWERWLSIAYHDHQLFIGISFLFGPPSTWGQRLHNITMLQANLTIRYQLYKLLLIYF